MLDRVSLAATSLQQNLWRPIFRSSRCMWLLLRSDKDNHLSRTQSAMTLEGPSPGFTGVAIDTQRQPFKIGRLIFVPVCVEKTATVGTWAITIKTEVTDTVSPLQETVTASFQLR